MAGIRGEIDYVIKQLENWGAFFPPTSMHSIGGLRDLFQIYSASEITDGEIEAALGKSVVKRTRRDYDISSGGIISTGYIGLPEHLVYAISQGEFTDREIRKVIREDCREFCRRYEDPNLLKNMRARILDPVNWIRD